MNFTEAIDHVSSKLSMAITREDQHAILRPLLVEAYRDGKRRAKRELMQPRIEVIHAPLEVSTYDHATELA